MTSAVVTELATCTLALAAWGVWRAARTWWRFRGKLVVACPEGGEFAAVDLALWRIAAGAAFRQPSPVLRDCSRLHQGVLCGQACIASLAKAPENYRVTTLVAEWRRGKNCACCNRPLGQQTRWGNQPCLLSPDLQLVEWKAIPAQDIPVALTFYEPVCWNCLVAETHIS